jgi:hypothetical protein
MIPNTLKILRLPSKVKEMFLENKSKFDNKKLNILFFNLSYAILFYNIMSLFLISGTDQILFSFF